MIKVEFLGPIGVKPMELDVKNLGQLKDILSQNDEISKWLKLCAVALNDEIINDINTELKSGDRICILPPVCGG
ncbi:molybdopterin synthase, small subunit [Campylobacter vicugnae]|uniref:Molybdopterin synthase, small subunit n=1 Tax=Campylobacter vicugnae TaxID=1660076 RepID=A0A1X9T3M8_9BACT|nr:MoaD/ThiS family protein [Campylobacter sp. RM8964]ARR03071.1 molybdopterin synthase, small subunit [Campylobacter sp. RM8964]